MYLDALPAVVSLLTVSVAHSGFKIFGDSKVRALADRNAYAKSSSTEMISTRLFGTFKLDLLN